MKLGVTIFATDRTISPVELAREAEGRGFSSLYLPEHTHIPVSRETPPPTGESVLPDAYARTLDPLAALAAAGAVTRSIRLGTGVCLAAQRDPIVTAKAVATVDTLSGGRFVFGVGYGWNREEMANHGVGYGHRRDRLREHVLAMRELWRREVAHYSGDFVRFAPSWSWPKPPSGPQVLIGGAAGPRLFAHIAEFADGWLPFGGAGVKAALPALARAAETAGRDPAALTVIPFGTLPTAAKLDYYARMGITEVVARLPAGSREDVLPALDALARDYLDGR
ncbi:MAG: TIGR03619 family F420-dependent LLM class oxidoreductase [Micromonosporaceae bacterium]